MNANDFGKLLDEKLEPFTTQFEELNGRMEALEDAVDGVSLHRIVKLQTEQRKIEKRLSTISGKLGKMPTIQKVEEVVAKAVDNAREELKHKIFEFKSDILGELQNIRDDMAITTGYSDRLEDHEDRIEKVEKHLHFQTA